MKAKDTSLLTFMKNTNEHCPHMPAYVQLASVSSCGVPAGIFFIGLVHRFR